MTIAQRLQEALAESDKDFYTIFCLQRANAITNTRVTSHHSFFHHNISRLTIKRFSMPCLQSEVNHCWNCRATNIPLPLKCVVQLMAAIICITTCNC
jgi:hypothetical protein